MNKKGQYYPRPTYTSLNPMVVIGVFMFIIPFLMPVINIDLHSVIDTGFRVVGIIMIIIGAALSIFNASNR